MYSAPSGTHILCVPEGFVEKRRGVRYNADLSDVLVKNREDIHGFRRNEDNAQCIIPREEKTRKEVYA